MEQFGQARETSKKNIESINRNMESVKEDLHTKLDDNNKHLESMNKKLESWIEDNRKWRDCLLYTSAKNQSSAAHQQTIKLNAEKKQ